jgi:hypothetical protein
MSLFSSTILYLSIFLMFGHLIVGRLNSNKLIIDHITCLYFGFMYYFFIPIIAINSKNNGLFQNLTPIKQFNSLSVVQVESCLLTFLGFILVIIIADLSPTNKRNEQSHYVNHGDLSMKMILLLTTIFIIPSVFDMVPSFFSSYDTSLWVRGSRGPFLSYIVILITLSSMYLSQREKINLLNIFTIFAFIFSLLNLFTGNRGFFISFIVSLVIIFSELNKGVKLKNLLFLFTIGAIVTSLLASIRSVGIPVGFFENINNIVIAQFLAEGLNVANSLFIYIGNYSPDLIEFPSSFLSQFINLIPSFLFPSKFEYLSLDPRVTYYLSSSHFYVILMTNFGIIGSILFMYFFTKFLNFVRHNSLIIGIYPALCAYIPFMFFRDFDLTIVKYMFEFTILVGILTVFLNYNIKKVI